jgi:hypothetical protein
MTREALLVIAAATAVTVLAFGAAHLIAVALAAWVS